jgi:prepilin-type N-terminal cleavage/methylation domain-containing protein
MFTIKRGGHRGGHKSGFTLIELLVVIAIIGILSSVVLASLNSARQKGRDAKRISDIKQIQLALELYYDANGKYPATVSSTTLVTPGYIAALPTDPVGGTEYSYAAYYVTGGTASICTSYHVGASLEGTSNSVLASDSDTLTTPDGYTKCTGSDDDFDGGDDAGCATGDAGTACYDVKS